MAEQIGVEAVFDLGDFNRGIADYQKGLDKAESSTSGFTSSLSKGWGDLGNVTAKAATILGGAVVTAAAAAGAAIVGVGVQGVKSFMEFQTSMNEVFTLLPGISQGAMNDMTEQVKQFSKDFGVLPEEVVPALYQSLSAGVPADNVFAFLEVANKAAVGGVTTLETAVNGISSVVNAYGSDVISAGKASDLMFTAVRLGKTNFEELSASLFQVIPTAASLGVGFDQVTAALAAMTLQGVPTSVATTQLRQLFVELSKDGGKTAATFEKLSGKTFAEFVASGGNVADALAIMEKGAEKSGVRLSDMFGSVEAGNAALALTGKGAETFNNDLKEMHDVVVSTSSATDAAYDQMNTGIQDALDDLKVAWSVALLDIGGALAPALEYLASLAAEHLPAVTDALGAMFTEIGAVIGYLVALTDVGADANEFLDNMSPLTRSVVEQAVALVQASQDLVKWIGDTVGQFISWKDIAIVLGAALASVVIPAIVGVIAAMAPMVLVFTGAVLAVAALRLAWETNFLGIRDITTAVVQAVIDSIGPITTAFTDLSETVLPFLTEHWKELAAGVSAFVAVLLVAQIPALLGGIGAAAGVAGAAIGALASPLLLVAAAVAVFAMAWTGNWFGVRDATTEAVNAVLTAIQPLTDAIHEFGAGALTEIKNFATGNETEFTNVKAIWDAAKVAASTLFGSIVGYVTDNLPTWKSNLVEWGTAAWAWIVTAAGLVGTKLGEWYTALTGALSPLLTTWKTNLIGWATAAWQWIVDAAGQVATKLGEWYTALTTALSGKLTTWKTAFLEWITATWQWIVDAAGSIPAKLGEWYTALKTALDGKLTTWKTAFVEWITASWQWLIDAKSNFTAKVGEWYTALKTALDGKLPIWKTAFTEWITAAWQWIVDSSTNFVAKVGEWYTALKTTLDSKLPAWKSALIDWRDAAWQWIKDSTAQLPGKIAEWFTNLKTEFASKLPTFKVEMLKFATELVAWIGSSAADALPELGKWLGRLVAWIPLGVLFLAASLIKMAAALVGWIAGGEGTSESASAAGQTDEAMTEFQKALIKALGQIKQGFIEAVQAFVTEWQTTMSEYVDWNQLGKDILDKIKGGWEAVRDTVYASVALTIARIQRLFSIEDWLATGKYVLNTIWDGIAAVKETVLTSIGTLITDMKDKFTSFDWAGTGKAIIDGILKGLKDNGSAIVDYLTGLGTDALDAIKRLFGISSPSKVMAKIGEDIIDGWVEGLKHNAPKLYLTVSNIAGTMLGNVLSWQSKTLSQIGSSLGNLTGQADKFLAPLKSELDDLNSSLQSILGEGFSDWKMFPWFGDLQPDVNRRNLLNDVVSQYEGRKRVAESLQAQAELMNFVKSAGLDVAQFFKGVTFGSNIDPVAILRSLTAATAVMNDKLKTSLEIAVKGYDKLVDTMRAGRKSFDEMVDSFKAAPTDQLTAFKNQLETLDTRIAEVEQEVLTTGSAYYVSLLQTLSTNRTALTNEIRQFLVQMSTAQSAVDRIRKTSNEQAQKAIEDFRSTMIDPLIEAMNSSLTWSPSVRDQYINLINQRVDALNRYTVQIEQLSAVQKSMEEPLTGPDAALAKFFDPATMEAERNNIIRYMQQIKTLGDLQRKAAGFGGALGDRLRSAVVDPLANFISDLGLTEQQRQGGLDKLSRIISQFNLLRSVVKDTSAAASINPLVSRFETERMDKLLDQFYDLNTSEAQRLAIMQQYRVEQEKVLALQQKQQQLDYLNQQLDLFNQLKQLNEQFDDIVPMESILSGITFGLNASLDDMLLLTSRVIDVTIATVKDQLGIHSPSKVFAQLGEYMMQGLGQGIWNSRQYPIAAMATATQQVPYSLTNNRNMNIYMGGVSINNGMDDAMFEARIRQVVEGML